MKISVIIPVYNVERYIVACLKSVVSQSWKGEIECILIDDCSTDSSLQLINDFVSSYAGTVEFVIRSLPVNSGVAAARNLALDMVTGDYVYILDSDDAMSEHCLQLMVDSVQRNPGVDFVQGTMVSIPYRSYYDRKALRDIDVIKGNDSIREQFYELQIHVTDKLYSTDFIRRNRLRFHELHVHEDDLWSYYSYRAAQLIAIVHEPTYIHYIHEGSLTTTLSPGNDRENWYKVLEILDKVIEDPHGSNLEKYFTGKLPRYYDGSAKWKALGDAAVAKLKDHGHRIDAFILRRALARRSEYYGYWLKNYRNRPMAVQLMAILKHW